MSLGKRDALPPTDKDEDEGWEYMPPSIPSQGRGGTCIVCTLPSGYKCAGCHHPYCSQGCYAVHRGKCSGEKRVQAYKSMRQYSDSDLHRDFTFISNILEGYSRHRKRMSGVDASLNKHQEMVRYRLLSSAAQSRGMVVSPSPRFMQRHRENISFVYTREDRIYWVGEVMLVHWEEGQWKVCRHLSMPTAEDREVIALTQSFPWGEARVIALLGGDMGRDNQRIVDSGLKIYVRNTYDKDMVDKDKKMDDKVRDRVMEGREWIELDWRGEIGKQIRNLTVREYPSFYMVREEDRERFLKEYK